VAARQSRPKGPAWDRLDLAPVVLLLVGEPVVGDRAVARLVRAALERDRTTAVTRIDAEEYGAGTLRTLAGPSLFGEPRAIVASRLHRMNDAFLADAQLDSLVQDPSACDVLLLSAADGVSAAQMKTAVESALPDGFVVGTDQRVADAEHREVAERHLLCRIMLFHRAPARLYSETMKVLSQHILSLSIMRTIAIVMFAGERKKSI